jgi:hypothetical protein
MKIKATRVHPATIFFVMARRERERPRVQQHRAVWSLENIR